MTAVPTIGHAGCDDSLTRKIDGAARVVESLRPEKPAQMRVVAVDGSEYTSGQALWMKGQLHSIRQACTRGDDAAAAATLRGVQDVLNRHGKGSTPAA